MPSYDDQFPIRIEPRPTRFDSKETDPAVLAREELKRVYDDNTRQRDQLLVAIAQTFYQLRRIHVDLANAPSAVHCADGIDIVADNLEQLLAENEVLVEDLTGSVWNANMSAEVDIRAHSVRHGLAEPIVVHMELPVVRRADCLLAKGAAIIEAPPRN